MHVTFVLDLSFQRHYCTRLSVHQNSELDQMQHTEGWELTRRQNWEAWVIQMWCHKGKGASMARLHRTHICYVCAPWI